jgi:eukaryotic-like serine/threonine-protein kinase
MRIVSALANAGSEPMSSNLPPGARLGRYEIKSQLGVGGMGEVYLAQDTQLDRRVGLKILPADVASNRDRMDRFVREAKSAASLSHPNIAQIFEIGEVNGVHFIAMASKRNRENSCSICNT